MEKVYIVSALRTAVGRFGGSLKQFSSAELCAEVIKATVKDLKVSLEKIDEVIIGNVYQAGGKANPARQAALMGGIPNSVPAMTINKQCASGMRSVSLAYQQIKAGEANLIVAGGTESMSNVPYISKDSRWGKKLGAIQLEDSILHDGLICSKENYHMGVTAENVAEQYNISRKEQDIFALNSQVKAAEAIQNGVFEKEIVPIETIKEVFLTDEHPRATSLEALEKLPAAFKENGSVSAGSASGLNDGASVLLIASESMVKEYNLTPLAEIISVASAGVDPSVMGIGPVPATKLALKKANLRLEDIDLIELNEAFASQALAVIKELNLNEEIVNVNGGAIALGHPVGSSGSRIIVSLVHELIRRNKEYGLATLCIGGGQGATVIVRKV
ncbi:acetyl-CoA C-acetyltransferase [Psychrobacillus sp. INOP01]|uniref:thiolase family protein n=1 Tax=Psychrobacillus sp. INOP01 TaxID=2829187 RepID=UPI001BAA12D3|nr:acetyl-CoA C-acetyltransferase [Psychrobacillus sp. INOP01]QUG40201.1 acetyl-CoA C-acetyltransferase [Psychrobacillus sp. INOP01]